MQVELDVFQRLLDSLNNDPNLPSAEQRYSALREVDPYPHIPPALLHAGHLASYAVSTGMIDTLDLADLTKPASYLVSLGGPVRYIDENNIEQQFVLSKEKRFGEKGVRKSFELRPNSLCYVTLQPKFRMPAYLAGRFNLLIRDVYRGLLVGTGPLVDPGFVGYISIPLHNFTSNSYTIRADEGFVYFEFTKISWKNPPDVKIPDWVPVPIEDQPPFPSSKNNRKDLDDYIYQATGGRPAQNALIWQIDQVKATAQQAKDTLRNLSLGAWVVGAGLVIATISGIGTAFQIYLGAQQYTQSVKSENQTLLEKQNDKIAKFEQEIDALKKRIEELNSLKLERFRPRSR